MPYEIMMYAALACAAISFTIALILFINLRIPTVIGDLTGSNARKEIAAMKDAGRKGNAATGKTDRGRSFGRRKKKTESAAVISEPEKKSKGTEKLSMSAPAGRAGGQERPQPMPEVTHAASPEMSVPQTPPPEGPVPEQNYPAGQPAAFAYGNMFQPDMTHGAAAAGVTGPDPSTAGQTIWISYPDQFSTEGTTVLSAQTSYPAEERKASFTLIKHIVVVNTQESIK